MRLREIFVYLLKQIRRYNINPLRVSICKWDFLVDFNIKISIKNILLL